MRLRHTTKVICKSCNTEYSKRTDTLKNWTQLCRKCTSIETGNKAKGSIRVPRKSCIDCQKVSYWIKVQDRCKECLLKYRSLHPEATPRYKQDRSTLAKKQERNDSAYRDWRNQVWSRDKWSCRIADNKCNGRLEAHHILGWAEHPELRYKINNGITLCHAHHPRVRSEEKRLIPTFTELASMTVSK